MKKIQSLILILLAAFASHFSVLAQVGKAPGNSREKEIARPAPNLAHEKKKMLISILEKQETDWNKGNLKGFLSAYWNSDTLRSLSVRGLQYGYDRLEKKLLKNYPDSVSMGHLDYDVIQIELIGEMDAMITGKWLRKNDKKFQGGFFTVLMRKIKGRWLIVSEQLS
jgi:hypothetical protein